MSAGRLAEFPANVEKLGALHAFSLPQVDGMKRAGVLKSRSINYHETRRVSIFSRSLSGLNRLHSRAEYKSPTPIRSIVVEGVAGALHHAQCLEWKLEGTREAIAAAGRCS